MNYGFIFPRSRSGGSGPGPAPEKRLGLTRRARLLRGREADIEMREKRLMDFAEVCSDWLWETDDKYRLIFLTQRIEDLTGHPPDWWYGKLAIRLGFRLVPRTRIKILRAMIAPQEFRDALVEGRDQHGKPRILSVSGRPFFDKAGHLLGYRGSATDVSHELEAARTRTSLEAQFYEAQKYRALGTLAGGVAHDFNNILAVILGHADLLNEEVPARGPARESLDEILRAGHRAQRLIEQILAYSRKGAESFRSFDLLATVHEITTMLRSLLPSSVTIDLATTDGALRVLGDVTQIYQVLINTCINARDALGGAPGRLTLRVGPARISQGEARAFNNGGALPEGGAFFAGPARLSADHRPYRHGVGTLTPGNHARIMVADTGCGMTPEVLERIFEPFFTTKEAGAGSGLGLAVVQGIFAGHKGAIRAETVPGNGTRFDVLIPLAPGDAEAGVNESANRPVPVSGAGLRVLLVDDDAAVLGVAAAMLQRHQFTVDAVREPRAALTRLQQAPDRWDLLVTDQDMPHCSGVELARAARAVRPNLPIVICTGTTSRELMDALGEIGINHVLVKPVSGISLAHEARRAIADAFSDRGASI